MRRPALTHTCHCLQVVDRILETIEDQLRGVPGGCSAMLVVGGFASSPYLMKRVKASFSSRVPLVWQAPQAGSAVLEGAVMFGALSARRGCSQVGPRPRAR